MTYKDMFCPLNVHINVLAVVITKYKTSTISMEQSPS